MDINEKSLKMHYEWKGKLRVTSDIKLENNEDLSLAYTPGVAKPCLEIQRDIKLSYDLTGRQNSIAVITDGTAVLGLGDIGPEAGMPVMEGKCLLFNKLAEIILEDELDPEYIIPSVFDKRVCPTIAEAVAEEARKEGIARI